MKILHVLPSLCVGGMETLAIDLSHAMRARGHDARIVTLDEPGPLAARAEATCVPLDHVDSRGWQTLVAPSPLSRYFEREQPDVVHSHNGSWIRALTAAMFAKVRVRAHTMHGFHEADVLKLRWIERLTIRATPVIIAVSEELRLAAERDLFAQAGHIHVVRNGIRLSTGDDSIPRQMLGLHQRDVIVIAVGRLTAVKAHSTLLSAFSQLSERFPHARLLIAGDGPERRSLEAQILDAGLGTKVQLLGARRDVRALLRMSDIFCLPSLSEGLSISLLEAMGEGVPVVATAVGSTPEVVTAECGIMVPPGESAPMAAAIAVLLGDAAARKRLGENGRARVCNDFSVQRTADIYLRMYSRYLARSLDQAQASSATLELPDDAHC